jgi:xanthine dehydrogenase molybdopterin-binding subunit B
MGQGIHTNMRLIAAKELGIPVEKIRVMNTSTDKVPNTSATAASAGTDLNGGAVKNACEILRERLAPVAPGLIKEKCGRPVAEEAIHFKDGFVFVDDTAAPSPQPSPPMGAREKTSSALCIPFAQVVQKAYFERVSLSAAGYYRTPDIHWDRVKGRGKPFHYFAYGAAVTEVEVDGFTGMTQVLRVDILQDVGDSINAGVNRGQVEGGFVQGMGWLTGEELKWDDKGRLLTHSPDTYKIPSIGDVPREFHVKFLENATQGNVIHGSKAVGEPPLMLAISVREAIRDAVAAFGAAGGQASLASPATCEAIFMAIRKRMEVDGVEQIVRSIHAL